MYIKLFTLFSHIILVLVLGYYLIVNLQWYNYKLQRVVLKHKRYSWHIIYFLVPLFAYYLTGIYFWIYFYFAYIPSFYLWYKKLDKKLVFTARVKRFFLFLILAVVFEDFLCLATDVCKIYGITLPLFVSLMISFLFEKIIFNGYKKEAQKKLESMKDLTIIAITASYGKTSIKNFLHQILQKDFKTYMTPRSVNTLGGLIKDINNDLPSDTRIYIAEAGARERGDINDIAKLLNHHYAIVGKIGTQHIEYFKSLENIRNTKMEILNSKNLIKAYVHKSANVKPNEKVKIFGDEIKNIKANLDGISFDLPIDGQNCHFNAPVLGEFNAINITAAILIAHELKMGIKSIQKRVSNLKSVEHRLQKMEAGGKLIIDDSFNGNLEGMISSYELLSSYKGRKVIITPGIMESTKEDNEKLAKKIDEIFDIAIITGKVNADILIGNIKKARKIILSDKGKMELTLAKETKAGDLILFSNDAPNFL